MERVVASPVALTWPLVGREAEVAALAAALEDPACGGVALVGTAGVGKTRLAQRATELAAERGLTTVSVRATRSAVDIPFAALTPFMARYDLPTTAGADLFVAAARALEGQGDRLVLVVDDAQWLDDASAALLDHLVELDGIFVVLTLRTGEPHTDAVFDMWKDERVWRVEVTPLVGADLRRLATLALDGTVEEASLSALVRASAGNVLFLRELIGGAVESGALGRRFGIWRLTGPLVHSPRLRDLIEHRFAGLGDAEREALELLALGEPLELSTLDGLVGPGVVEALERRGVVDAVVAEPEPEVRLAHPLYGEAVRTHLSPIRRARLCAALADATESEGDLGPADTLRVAVWRLDSGGTGRPGTTMAAARLAFAGEDYGLTARLTRLAWEGWGDEEAVLLLCDALDAGGRTAEAAAVAQEAYLLATDDRQRTHLIRSFASNVFRLPGRAGEAAEALALADVQITDPACRRDLTAQLADNCLLAGDVRRALELALPLLESPGDGAFAQASRDVGTALAFAGRTEEALRHVDQALATVSDLADEGELNPEAVFVVARCLALCLNGRLAEAADLAEMGRAVCVERRNAGGQAWFAVMFGLVRLTQGRLAAAIDLFRESAALYHAHGHPGERWAVGGVALAAGQQGDREAAAGAVAELAAVSSTAVGLQDVSVTRGRAWAALAGGDLAACRTLLWEAVALGEGWGQWATVAEALHDLVRVGEGREAAQRLLALTDRVDGALMAARRDYARAVAERDRHRAAAAADGFEAAGALLFAAEAAALERQLCAEAGLARRATAAAARCTRLVQACEAPRTPPLVEQVGPVKLSVREREVALLAAEGCSSREIAERLFLSTRTVDNHLQRVYAKLGVSARSELAGALGAAGPPPA